jgi:hypothetical protein
MSHKQRVTVVAVIVLVASLPILWQIGDVRATTAVEEQQTDLVDRTVSARQAPNDYDGDGIADGSDQCPTRPETQNGYQDADGCPDIVETTGAS